MTIKAVDMEATFSTSKYDAAMKHMQTKTKSTTKVISTAWFQVAGSIYAVTKAWDMMQMGAKAQQQAQAFNNMAASFNASGDQIIAKLREVSVGTVDTMTLIEKAGTGMMMGIAPDDLIRLMDIARATSKLTGQTVTKAFEDISLAVGRQSRMILDNLGIIVKQGEANDAYAQTLGKTASQLTDAEKKQAFMNATLEAGTELMKKLNMEAKTTAESFQSFEAMTKNAWMWTSKLLVFIAKGYALLLSELYAGFNNFIADTAYWASNLLGIISNIPGAKALGFDDLSMEVKNIADNFNLAAQKAYDFSTELSNLGKASPVVPFMPTGGGGTGSDGGSDGGGSNETSYQDRILWHDASQITDMWLAHDKGRREAHKRALEMIEQQDIESFNRQQEAQLERFVFEGEMLQQSYGDKEMMRWTHNEKMAQLREEYEGQVRASNQKIVNIERQTAQVRWQIAESLSTTMMTVAGASDKAIFLMSKGFAMAQAFIYTQMASAMALATPPVPNVALAAVTEKMGYAKMALIGATAIGGLVTGGTSGGGGSKGGADYPDVGTPETSTLGEEKKSTTTINIQGDFFGEESWIDNLVERINEAGTEREVFVNWTRGSGELVT